MLIIYAKSSAIDVVLEGFQARVFEIAFFLVGIALKSCILITDP